VADLKTLEDALAGAMCGTGWFPIHRAIISRVGLEAASVLHYLFNLRIRTRETEGSKPDGWFFCTVKRMENELKLSDRQQTRILAVLSVDTDLIEVKKMGLPARRHVRIDYSEVAKIIASWEENTFSQDEIGTTSEAQEGVTSNPKTGATSARSFEATGAYEIGVTLSNKKESNKKTKKTLSGPSGPDQTLGTSRKKEPSSFDYRAAEELARVISTYVKVNKKMKPKAWAEQFRLLREADGVPKDAIKSIIRWYAGHIGGKYDVQAFSAGSFRDKWEKLVAAKMRTGSAPAGRDGARRFDLDDPEQSAEYERLITRVASLMRERGTLPARPDVPEQDDVDEALAALGEEPGTIRYDVVE
jgi:hypothetical protein